jgi:hypothetical protein
MDLGGSLEKILIWRSNWRVQVADDSAVSGRLKQLEASNRVRDSDRSELLEDCDLGNEDLSNAGRKAV